MEQRDIPLAELDFVDLIIGPDFCELRGLKNSDGANTPAPPHVMGDVQLLRQQCRLSSKNQGQVEFTTTLNGARFRVTVMNDVQSEEIYILSRIGGEIRPFLSLGLPERLVKHLLRPDLSGLVLVSGPMGVGKTSTVGSLFVERLRTLGGFGLAIEDPPELPLNGPHGKGRAIQVEVSREHGGYYEQLQRSLRSRADQFLIGEIRDAPTATEVVRVSGNGWPILSTMHADTPEQSLSKLQALCRSMDASTDALNGMIAAAITALINLRIQKVETPSGHVKRLLATWLVLDGREEITIRAKIRKGDFAGLNTEIASQANAMSWSRPQ